MSQAVDAPSMNFWRDRMRKEIIRLENLFAVLDA
jgi:hypothetical protein